MNSLLLLLLSCGLSFLTRQLYSTSYDGTIRLWDFEDGVLLKVRLSDSSKERVKPGRAEQKKRQIAETRHWCCVRVGVCACAHHQSWRIGGGAKIKQAVLEANNQLIYLSIEKHQDGGHSYLIGYPPAAAA